MHGFVDEAAGVHHDQIGIVIGTADRVAFGAQLGQDLLGIHQRLRTAQADKPHAGQIGYAGRVSR
ncbi:hypothetical protein D3C85_1859780 [compost metagenome]